MWFTSCKKRRNQYRKKGDKTKRMKAMRSPVISQSDLYPIEEHIPPVECFLHPFGQHGNHLSVLLSLSLFERIPEKRPNSRFDFEIEKPKRHKERRHANGRRGEKERAGRGREIEEGIRWKKERNTQRGGSWVFSMYLQLYFRPSFYKTMVSTET